jgi:membrane-bound lytic murein transglycosylase MltF
VRRAPALSTIDRHAAIDILQLLFNGVILSVSPFLAAFGVVTTTRSHPWLSLLSYAFERNLHANGCSGISSELDNWEVPLMHRMRRLFLLLPLVLVVLASARAQTTLPALSEAETPALPPYKSWTGDFDKLKAGRLVRILVPFSKSIYFLDKGAERGTAAEFGRQFEVCINQKYKTKALKIKVAFVPVPRDRLLTGLEEGLGDIAAGSLTITPERQKIVDFSDPGLKNVKEVVVTGPSAPALKSLDDLAGQEIHVGRSTSYWDHLQLLSDQLEAKGLEKITLVPADSDLEDEDLLELVNAGILPFVVVDNYKARLWSKIFPHIKDREDLAVNSGGDIAWAVRKNSPLLLAEINECAKKIGAGSSFAAEVLRKYYVSTAIIKNAYSKENQAEFEGVIAIFKKYSDQYGFDYLMMAAQGFQESRLKQATHSPRGAVGVMQLLPSTAADSKIGITGIDKSADRNIEAGMKYMRRLIDVYLDDPKLDRKNRTLMAFAAYNAGPGNLIRFRKWAEKSGLDPNVWFFNTEEGAARIVGQETVQYVGNIYKYYIAYRLITERQAKAEQAKAVAGTTTGQ